MQTKGGGKHDILSFGATATTRDGARPALCEVRLVLREDDRLSIPAWRPAPLAS